MKKIFPVLSGLIIILSILMSTAAYASSSFDVSIDRARVNGQVVSESKSNFLNDADVFSVIADFTTVETLEKGHVEATLRGRQSGNVVSDATSTFDFAKNQTFSSTLTLRLLDKLTREDDYDLTVKIVDDRSRSRQKTYEIRTRQITSGKSLDVSVDRVKVNDKVVAQSSTNSVGQSNEFNVNVEFTALETLSNAHVEAVLKDLNSGNVAADASPNFNLAKNSASSKLMHMELLNGMKNGNSLELAIKIIDADGNSITKSYGLRMRNAGTNNFGNFGEGNLDLSINSVEIENNNIVEDKTNFVALSSAKKDLSVRASFTPRENLKQSHIDAVLTFENGDSVSDTTPTFDAGKDQTTTQTFRLALANSKFTQAAFGLKLKFVDNDGNFLVKNYIIKLTPQKNPFAASVISLSPDGDAQAGKSLGVSVNLRNLGTMPLEGIVLKVSIPELDAASLRFIDQFKDQTEDFLLKIPDSAASGTYTLRTEVISQVSGSTQTREIPFTVVNKNLQAPAESQLAVNVPLFEQNLKNDGSEAVYPMTLTNKGMQSSTYTILLSGNDNINLRLSESNTFILGAGESKTAEVYASSTGRPSGRQNFFATIKSDGKVVQQVALRASITGTGSVYLNGLKTFFEVFLVIVAVVLAGIGLFFGVMKLLASGNKTKSEETSTNLTEEIPDNANGEAYY